VMQLVLGKNFELRLFRSTVFLKMAGSLEKD